jgi:hypothetical protein
VTEDDRQVLIPVPEGLPVKEHQITVPLPADLREFLEHRAAAEDRSLASAARQILAREAARAARRQAQPPAAA